MKGAFTFLVVVLLFACTACSAQKSQVVQSADAFTAGPSLPRPSLQPRMPETKQDADASEVIQHHTEVHVSVLKIVISAPQPGNLVIGSQTGAVAR